MSIAGSAVEVVASLDGGTDPEAASAGVEDVEWRARRALAGLLVQQHAGRAGFGACEAKRGGVQFV